MSKEKIRPIPEDVNSQEYWEKILNGEGLPSKLSCTETRLSRAGYNASSWEKHKQDEHDIKNAIADAVRYENEYPSATPINRSTGLAPCQMAKAQEERDFDPKNFIFEET